MIMMMIPSSNPPAFLLYSCNDFCNTSANCDISGNVSVIATAHSNVATPDLPIACCVCVLMASFCKKSNDDIHFGEFSKDVFSNRLNSNCNNDDNNGDSNDINDINDSNDSNDSSDSNDSNDMNKSNDSSDIMYKKSLTVSKLAH